MRFVVWNKEKINNLSDMEKSQYIDFINNSIKKQGNINVGSLHCDEFRDINNSKYLKDLHEFTRTPNYMSYFVLYNEEQNIVSLCRVIEKYEQFYLEEHKIDKDYIKNGYDSFLIKSILLYLKELDVLSLRLIMNSTNCNDVSFYEKIGFVIYDSNKNNVRLKYHIMTKPRYYNIFYQKFFFLALILGISYHRDNNKRYYKSFHKSQVSNTLFIGAIVGLLCFYFNNYSIYIIVNISFILSINFLNTVRYFIYRDKQYLENIVRFAITSSSIVFIFALVGICIKFFLR